MYIYTNIHTNLHFKRFLTHQAYALHASVAWQDLVNLRSQVPVVFWWERSGIFGGENQEKTT